MTSCIRSLVFEFVRRVPYRIMQMVDELKVVDLSARRAAATL